jgi:hypothetical protein
MKNYQYFVILSGYLIVKNFLIGFNETLEFCQNLILPAIYGILVIACIFMLAILTIKLVHKSQTCIHDVYIPNSKDACLRAPLGLCDKCDEEYPY